MIPEDKILAFDLRKIPETMSVEDYIKHLESLEHPELEEGVVLIDKFPTNETGL
jgi:hypothetical protein